MGSNFHLQIILILPSQYVIIQKVLKYSRLCPTSGEDISNLIEEESSARYTNNH